MAPRKKAAVAPEAIDPQIEAPAAEKKAAAAPPRTDTFVGPDGRIYRRIHVQRGNAWIDKTELVG